MQPQTRAHNVATFLAEADAHLLTIAQTLVAVERAPDDRAKLDALCAAAHSLSTGAHDLAFTNLGSLAQAVEDVLVAVRENGLKLGGTLTDAIFVALDGIEALLGMLKAHGAETPSRRSAHARYAERAQNFAGDPRRPERAARSLRAATSAHHARPDRYSGLGARSRTAPTHRHPRSQRRG